jgi:hypothetical protein
MLFLLVQSFTHFILSQLCIVLHLCHFLLHSCIKPSTQIIVYDAADVFELQNSIIRSSPLTTYLKVGSKAP